MRLLPALVASLLLATACGDDPAGGGDAVTVRFKVFDRGENRNCADVPEIEGVSVIVKTANGLGALPGFPRDVDCAAGTFTVSLAAGDYTLEIIATGRLGATSGQPLFKSRGPFSMPTDDGREISLKPEAARFELSWVFANANLDPCNDEVASVDVLISVGADAWYSKTHDCRDTPVRMPILFAPRTYSLVIAAYSEARFPLYNYEASQILLPDENEVTAELTPRGGQIRLDWEFVVGDMPATTSCNDAQVGASTMRISVTTSLGDEPVRETIGCVVQRPYTIRASRFTAGRPLQFEIITEGVHRFRHYEEFIMPMDDRDLNVVTMQAVGSATVAWSIGAGSACSGRALDTIGVLITKPNAGMNDPPVLIAAGDPMSTQLALPHVPYGDHLITLAGVKDMTPVCSVSDHRAITGRENAWAAFDL